ncbi:MAG: hypothetical protein HY754_11270 [Nitrospirae bacterium]|nr:hypothetical protein [Nitrospirota bacterium]
MKTLAGIAVVQENGVFRVPADFAGGFILVPRPEGRLNLFFWERNRMRRFLRNYGFTPLASSTRVN